MSHLGYTVVPFYEYHFTKSLYPDLTYTTALMSGHVLLKSFRYESLHRSRGQYPDDLVSKTPISGP